MSNLLTNFKKTVTLSMLLISFLMAFIMLITPYSAFAQSDKDKITIGEYRVLHSKILGENRRVWVHLPDCYHSSNQNFPVIYKCDAISIPLFAAKIRDLNTYDLKYNIPRFILVSIENTDRNRDMFPAHDSRKHFVPGAPNFLRFIETELIPFIEKQYRTDGYRVLMGESNSAMFAVYASLENPRLFHGYIAASPELDWCFEYFATLAGDSLARKDFNRRHLYMIYGEKDNKRVLGSAPRFADILKKKAPAGFRWQLEMLPGEGHVPDSSLKKGLLYILDGYRAPKETVAGGPEAIENYYTTFSKKIGHHFNPPGKPFLDYAMLLLRQKKKDEALKLLMTITKNHHENSVRLNALLTAASIFRSKGRTENAIKCYKQAILLSPPMEGFLNAKIIKLQKER
jgi:uncharacterized protein